uniref:Uncharacterized protein n=1 Tax=Hyaloperonospora arabidopsidis (strain Emoy2) TaxID=559515 RepID=M4BYX7_HYAAE
MGLGFREDYQQCRGCLGRLPVIKQAPSAFRPDEVERDGSNCVPGVMDNDCIEHPRGP